MQLLPLAFRHAMMSTLSPGVLHSLTSFRRHRCIFVHIPKCAGISVARSLGIEPDGHTTIATYQMIFSPADFRDYFKFAVVRNPWDRLLSAFLFLKNGGIATQDKVWADRFLAPYETFDAFVMRWVNTVNIKSIAHFRPQTDYICIRRNEPALDFIARYEDLEADFRHICEKVGVTATLLRLNAGASGVKGYRDCYTDEARDKVAKVYADDIHLLGYRF
jgi:hypothetical protein